MSKKPLTSQQTITIASARPSEEEKSRNIKAGQEAFQRAAKVLTTPGVKLPKRRGVPLFWADENDPTIIIRFLDGKRERGRFVNGGFETTE